MSRKNHEMVNGKLLQTDKKYANLKLKQKDKIAEWMFLATKEYYMKTYTFPDDKHLEEVVDNVYRKIEAANIWIPYREVFKHYKAKRANIKKRVRRTLNDKSVNQIEKVCFMNMCMIQDDKGNVLVLDKTYDSYTKTTFPYGYVEPKEIFQTSMIKEILDQTGLKIENAKFCGLFHWHKGGVHYVTALYKTNHFTGELKSYEESRLYWISLQELKSRKLSASMKYILQIMESDHLNECYMHLETEGYVGTLY